MIFFFYGTLMDRELLEALAGPKAAQLRLTPGRLLNYRRVSAVDGYYPVLLPCPGGRVSGCFVEGLDRRSLQWIAHFEGAAYLPTRVQARDLAGQRLRPWAFMPVSAELASRRGWDFRLWQLRCKPQVKRLLANWWVLSAGPDLPLSMDVPWRVRRRLDDICARRDDQPRPNPHLLPERPEAGIPEAAAPEDDDAKSDVRAGRGAAAPAAR